MFSTKSKTLFKLTIAVFAVVVLGFFVATPTSAEAVGCTVACATTINGDAVYCDSSLRMWSPTAATTKAWGPTGEAIGSCTGKGAGYPACNYCDTLNYAGLTGWTLPTKDVLTSFWTAPCGSASCGLGNSGVSWDTNAQADYYWSSTEYASGTYDAWFVLFSSGYVSYDTKNNGNYVRCVREAPPPAVWDHNSAPTSPSQPQGVAGFTKSLTGLTAETKYYYSTKAVNSAGTTWASATRDFTTTAVATHKACNEQHQCVSVEGEGSNLCSIDDDCVVTTLLKVKGNLNVKGSLRIKK